MKLQRAIEIYLADCADLSAATVKKYRVGLNSLLDLLGDVDMSCISRADVRAWRDHLKTVNRYEKHPNDALRKRRKKLSSNTIHGRMGTVSIFFNWCVVEGWMEQNHLKGMRRPRKTREIEEPKAITEQDFQALLKAAEVYRGTIQKYKEVYPARNCAIVLFLRSTGCRAGALCNALEKDLKWNEDGSASVTTKTKGAHGGKTIRLRLSQAAGEALKRWLAIKPASQHLFCGVEKRWRGRPMTPSAILSMLNRCAEAAGIKGANNPHSFRHGFAVAALENGAALTEVSQCLHHTSITTTANFYSRYGRSHLDAIHARIAPV